MDPNASLLELLQAVLRNDRERAHEIAEALQVCLLRDGLSPFATQPAGDYQGWKNFATWAVHLHLTGDQATDGLCRCFAQRAIAAAPMCGQVREGTWRIEEAPRLLLREDLKELFDCRNPLRDEASVYADLLGSAMYTVDWDEIAEAFLEP